jgi:NAD-dependent deacetylase
MEPPRPPISTDEREGIEHAAWLRGSESALHAAIAEVASWVAGSKAIVVLTGAGISTDSGIPDFRGKNGVWTRNPAAEKASTLSAYLGDPEVRKAAWQIRRRSPAWHAQPNSGHLALVTLERGGRLDTLVTQNTDGLHLIAGHDPARVLEVHGSMRGVRCVSCGESADMQKALDRVDSGEEDPPCRTCGGILKATTVLFEESLDPDVLDAAMSAAARCDLLLAVGSKLAVYPAAALPGIAKARGATFVTVNGGPTDQDDLADAVLRGSISEILPALVPTVEPAGPAR